MSAERYDAIVIGGGPAGSSAAIRLAKAGVKVLILEREPGPHHKVCGEFLSAEAMPLLQGLGIDLTALGAVPIREARLHSSRRAHSLQLEDAGFGLSRYRLDEALLQEAQRSGAELIRGVNVEALELGEISRSVATSQGKFFAEALILATGKHEIKSLPPRRGRELQALGFKSHLKLQSERHEALAGKVELFFFKGGYAGICGIEGGIDNLCLILDKAQFKALGGNFPAALDGLRREHPALHWLLEGAEPLWPKPLSIAHLPYGFVQHCAAGRNEWEKHYRVGDQFAVIPSFTGSGMVIALHSGIQAAQDLLAARKGAPRRYETAMAASLRGAMRFAYPIHLGFKSPFWAELSLWGMRAFPAFARWGLRQTRIRTQGCIAKIR